MGEILEKVTACCSTDCSNSLKIKKSLVLSLARIFHKQFPEPKTELIFNSSFQLFVCVVLSAQTTDKLVNRITPAFFKKLNNFNKLAAAKISSIETLISSVNYYKTKAKNLKAAANLVVRKHKGLLPRSFDYLLALPGVGRKTASVICSELDIIEAFPVDTHVFRTSNRLGLANGKTVEEVESQLKNIVPVKLWKPMHHWLIFHGRRTCRAKKPLCKECAVRRYCKYYRLQNI